MRYLIPLLLLVLAGCASTPDANYSAYIEAHNRAEQQRAVAEQALSDAAACNGDAACVISVKAIAGLTMQGAGNRAQIAPPPRKATWSEHVRNVAGAVHPLGQIWAMVEGGRNNVEIARIGAEREARRDEAWAGMTVGIADAFSSQEPAYSYVIGGDYVPGQIGDNAGRDQIHGNQHLGDWRTGDNIARDTIGGDRIDTDYGTGNRLDSAGPYRDIGNGPRCEGAQCQHSPLPEPETEEGE